MSEHITAEKKQVTATKAEQEPVEKALAAKKSTAITVLLVVLALCVLCCACIFGLEIFSRIYVANNKEKQEENLHKTRKQNGLVLEGIALKVVDFYIDITGDIYIQLEEEYKVYRLGSNSLENISENQYNSAKDVGRELDRVELDNKNDDYEFTAPDIFIESSLASGMLLNCFDTCYFDYVITYEGNKFELDYDDLAGNRLFWGITNGSRFIRKARLASDGSLYFIYLDNLYRLSQEKF